MSGEVLLRRQEDILSGITTWAKSGRWEQEKMMWKTAFNHTVHLLNPDVFRYKYLVFLLGRKMYFEKINDIVN